jgi:hypothetical protein
VKKETMKNSEISAKARNKPIVNSPFGAVQLKARRSLFTLDVITVSLDGDVPSPLDLLHVCYVG